jgi:hypothetical protein
MNKFIAEEIQKGLEATPGFKGMPDIYEEASNIYSGSVVPSSSKVTSGS